MNTSLAVIENFAIMEVTIEQSKIFFELRLSVQLHVRVRFVIGMKDYGQLHLDLNPLI